MSTALNAIVAHRIESAPNKRAAQPYQVQCQDRIFPVGAGNPCPDRPYMQESS
jgi:hypothetical protein